jgi:hypothetical protein
MAGDIFYLSQKIVTVVLVSFQSKTSFYQAKEKIQTKASLKREEEQISSTIMSFLQLPSFDLNVSSE